MENQDVLDLPFPEMYGLRGKTVGQAFEIFLEKSKRDNRRIDNLQLALSGAKRERDEALERLESRTNEIDSFKVLDMLTRSTLLSKLEISADSEVGQTLTTSLIAALQNLSSKPAPLELEG